MSHGWSAEGEGGGDGGGDGAAGGGGDGGGDVIDAMIALSSSISAASAAHVDVESSSHVRHVAMHRERARVHFMPFFFWLGHCASGCSGVGRERA